MGSGQRAVASRTDQQRIGRGRRTRAVAVAGAMALAVVSPAAPVTLAAPAMSPAVTVMPESGPVGTTFTTTGTGFTPDGSATVHLQQPDSSKLPERSLATDGNGTFADEIDTTGFEPGIWRYWAVDDATGAMSNVHAIPISVLDVPFVRVDLETDSSPRALVEFHPFFVEHGWVLASCEDGQSGEFDSDLIFDDRLRVDLYVNDVPQGPDFRARCFELDDGSEVFAKNHRYWFPEGLPQGTYELRGEWWWHENPDEPMKVETLTLQVDASDEPPDASPTRVYVVSGPGPGSPGSDLYLIDPTAAPAGVDTLIGPIQTPTGSTRTLTDIALADDRTLYGVRSRLSSETLHDITELYVIDPETAVATLIGETAFMDVNGLEVSPDGRILGSTTHKPTFSNMEGLVEFDPEIGQATLIGNFGPDLGSSGDLAFSADGVLYLSAREAGVTNDVLATVDPETGAATRVNPNNDLGYSTVFGLFFAGDDLFGVTDEAPECDAGALLQVDRGMAIATFVRCLAFEARGATSEPQVSQLDDDFQGDTLDTDKWLVTSDVDAEVWVEAGELNIRTEAGAGAAGVVSTADLSGDFDVQVDYRLVDWPEVNRWYSARMGPMNVDPNPEAGTLGILRGHGVTHPDAPNQPNPLEHVEQVYVLVAQDRQGSVLTDDMSGSLRMLRCGDRMWGFFLDEQGAWQTVGDGLVGTEDTAIYLLVAGSMFGEEEPPGAHVAFDNVRVIRDPACPTDPPSVTVSAEFGEGGGTLSTSDGPTPSDPLHVAVTSPNAGEVTITLQEATSPPAPGTRRLTDQVAIISAPEATPENPLVIVWTIDASRVEDVDEADVLIRRGGERIPDCEGEPGVASPERCIADRTRLPEGHIQLTVLATTPSEWELLVPTLEQECVTLVADQQLQAGQVCVTHDGDDVIVTYTTSDGWTLGQSSLALSVDEPGTGQWIDRDHGWQNPRGIPSPGRFPFGQEHDPAVDVSATYVIPRGEIHDAGPGTILHVAAYARVHHGAAERIEGAWGDGERFVERGNWGTWFTYNMRQE